MTIRSFRDLLKESAVAWSEDYAPSMGAALAYYTLFSLAPLLVIVIACAGLVFGAEAARGEIEAQLRGLIGQEGAVVVQDLLKDVSRPATSIAASFFGVAMLLLGATSVFSELQSALDRIWKAPSPRKNSGLWGLVRTRLLSFGMILTIGFLLLLSLVISAVLSAAGEWWGPALAQWGPLLQVTNLVASLAMATLLFASIYKILPRVHVAWRDVWVGASVTAVLFTIGKFLIGFYIARSSVASSFGAAGSLVVLLVWIYYSAQIFLFGAEFTWVYARRCGSRVGESESAAPSIPNRSNPRARPGSGSRQPPPPDFPL
ncbi:MAG: YihY/virulence factor BrkB family protein [Candidatus Binatia bacterium]